METTKTNNIANVIFPALVLFCMALGFTAPSLIGCLLALIPVAACLVEAGDFEPASGVEDACPVGDWSDLLAELKEPAKAVKVMVAVPVWTGWQPVVAGVARAKDPVFEFEVEWVTQSGRKSRKRVPERMVQAEFARLARGGYTGVKVRKLAAATQ